MTEFSYKRQDASLDYTPDDTLHLFPMHPEDDRGIHLDALTILGYPVELQRVGVDEVRKLHYYQYPNARSQWELQRYAVWLRPVVTEPEFKPYIGVGAELDRMGLACTGTGSISDGDVSRIISEHAVGLNFEMYEGSVQSLLYSAQRALEPGVGPDFRLSPQLLERTEGHLTEAGLVLQAFLTTVVRHRKLTAEGHPDIGDELGDNCMPQEAVALEALLRAKGVRPLSVEARAGLALDFYEFYAAHVPEFAAFKRQKRAM